MSDLPDPGPWDAERDRLAAALSDLAALRQPVPSAFGAILPGSFLENIDWDGDARKARATEPLAAPSGFDGVFVDPDEPPTSTEPIAAPPVVNTDSVLNEFNWE
ncbi:MAG: hypothetical protein JNM56_40250 [Planctomycetia bacterium]|nr:hypothetical protein [Planctomycetia bacterium]